MLTEFINILIWILQPINILRVSAAMLLLF